MEILNNYYRHLDDMILAMLEDLEQLMAEGEDLQEFIEIWEEKTNIEIKFIEKLSSNLNFSIENRHIRNKLGRYILRMKEIISKNKNYFIQ